MAGNQKVTQHLIRMPYTRSISFHLKIRNCKDLQELQGVHQIILLWNISIRINKKHWDSVLTAPAVIKMQMNSDGICSNLKSCLQQQNISTAVINSSHNWREIVKYLIISFQNIQLGEIRNFYLSWSNRRILTLHKWINSQQTIV